MKTVWKIILVISLAVLLICAGIFGYDYLQKTKSGSIVGEYTKSTDSNTVKLADNPIDFDKLIKKNSDIYSWIKIENTNINYPILHPFNKSNDFYLRKNIDGEYDRQGVIFTENYNKTDWSDPVTVVYGHNIWTMGTMFYELNKFRDSDFFKKNKYINIYSKGRALKYEIYSAFEYDDRHIMNAFDFSEEMIFKHFIEDTLNPVSLNKNVRKNVNVTTNDKIIILSTCIKNKENLRYLVIGVLKEDEKTK